ncbi:uncharacterized protein BYT42DRAFT_609232 [Radiomyces spectabilis]|uniref:uncharacterized protein n=1 Tax=Radiomyces spectabilis TaxID=64574 RepID=UPI00222056C4|nr:uncharacterized protein BYT42DRAFT_609232 [Radiomyces spectabilis]KAI8393437.1 hypothetical protein BYT42DRAFT_609232 [Radiomyces spectabilis]
MRQIQRWSPKPSAAQFHHSSRWLNPSSRARKKGGEELLPSQRLQEIVHTLESPAKEEAVEGTESLIAAIDSHRPKSKTGVLGDQLFDKLQSTLRNSYTVPQLVVYLKHHDLKHTGRKDTLIARIINNHWGLVSKQQVSIEALRKKENNITRLLNTTPEEIFFVTGHHGHNMRQIEKQYGVKIVIDAKNLSYILNGPREGVNSARKELTKLGGILRVNVPCPLLKTPSYYAELKRECARFLPSISQMSGAYIDLRERFEFMVAGRDQEAIDRAKRLLSLMITEMNFVLRPPLTVSDHTFIQDAPQHPLMTGPFSMLAAHDSAAMPQFAKVRGWSRVSRTNNDQVPEMIKNIDDSFYRFFALKNRASFQEPGSSLIIKDQLRHLLNTPLAPWGELNLNTSLEATFGHLLFENPVTPEQEVNMLQPFLEEAFSAETLREAMRGPFQPRQYFFASQPPTNVTSLLLPFTAEGGIHQRTIVAEYVSTGLLAKMEGFAEEPVPTAPRRFQLHFTVDETGNLKPQKVIGEHGRSVIDLLALNGYVDARLCARRFVQYQSDDLVSVPDDVEQAPLPGCLEELLASCSLTGYAEMQCPPFIRHNDAQFALVDVAFRNEKRYLFEDHLVTIHQLEEQTSRAQRTELTIKSRDQEGEANAALLSKGSSWDNFVDTVTNIAKRWHF